MLLALLTSPLFEPPGMGSATVITREESACFERNTRKMVRWQRTQAEVLDTYRRAVANATAHGLPVESIKKPPKCPHRGLQPWGLALRASALSGLQPSGLQSSGLQPSELSPCPRWL